MAEQLQVKLKTPQIVQKHDVEANWLKAENFYPLKGQVIVYDPDDKYDYPRIKVGIWDGVSEKTSDMLVSNLPFTTTEHLLELGLSEYSIQQSGTGSVAGAKGFYWTEVVGIHYIGDGSGGAVSLKLAKATFDEGLVEPTEEEIKEAFALGDILTIHAGSKFDKAATVSGIYTDDFQGTFCHLMLNAPQNLLDAIYQPKNNEYKAGMDFSDNAIFCPAKPEAGMVDFGKYAFATGENSKALNYAATAFGRKNEAYGQYATAFGRENKVGYAGFAAGRNNIVTGESAAALNQGNTASGNWSLAGGYKSQATDSSAIAYGHSVKATGLYSTAFGEQTEAKGAGALAVGRNTKAEGEASQAFGRNTIAKSAFQFVAGKYNEEDGAENYAHILGGGHADNNRINIHTVDWYGNAWYKGDVVSSADIKAGEVSLIATSGTANQAKSAANEAKSLANARTGSQQGSYNEIYNYQNENAAPCFRGSTDYSHAEGYIFGGVQYHYIEDSSFAHIEGSQNRVVRSNGAHASGEWQQIYDSKDAAAFGHDNRISSAPNGFAAGHGNIVTKANQVVVGEFNSPDNDALFIVGNGASSADTDRKNAFVIKEDNTAYINGKKVLAEGDSAGDLIADSITLAPNEEGMQATLSSEKFYLPYGQLHIDNLSQNPDDSIKITGWDDYNRVTAHTTIGAGVASLGVSDYGLSFSGKNVGELSEIRILSNVGMTTYWSSDGSSNDLVLQDGHERRKIHLTTWQDATAFKACKYEWIDDVVTHQDKTYSQIGFDGSAKFKNEDGDTSISGAHICVSNGTVNTSISPEGIDVGFSHIYTDSILSGGEFRIGISDEGKYTEITNYGEYFGGDMTVNGSVTATSINIGGVTLTAEQLQKIINFIDSIGFKGGNA